MGFFDFLKYKWKYLPSIILSKRISSTCKNKEVLFVTHESTRGWILEAKAKRLSHYFPGNSQVFYSNRFNNLPDAEGYFFLHQKYFARAVKYNAHVLKRKTTVMFTHPEWSRKYSSAHMAYVLNFADKIICLNQAMVNELIKLGVKSSKLEVYHMASNPEMFKPKERTGNGAIGFCMGYYKRKNAGLMVDIIKQMPDKQFILIGRHWDRYNRFEEIKNLPNFKYIEDIPYEQYPEYYHQMDVFVSPSHLEGGPVPLLEAMLCNVVPVVSRTGFCPDLVQHGQNGFLFNSTDSVNVVIPLIRQAFELKKNVREAAEPHSWQNYGLKIGELFRTIKKDS